MHSLKSFRVRITIVETLFEMAVISLGFSWMNEYSPKDCPFFFIIFIFIQIQIKSILLESMKMQDIKFVIHFCNNSSIKLI